MNIKKIITINDEIKRILPKTYPRPKLVLCEDELHMLDVQGYKENALALYDPNTNSIFIPIKDYIPMSDVDVVKILLHEYCHAWAGNKYGWNSKEYFNEQACDRFSCRWLKKLDHSIFQVDNKRFFGWRNEEVEWLKEHYATTNKEKMIKRLDRTWAAIRAKAKSVGVKRT